MAPKVIKPQPGTKANNVVLVHGLYADGSCWLDVIPYLQTAGLSVTAAAVPAGGTNIRWPRAKSYAIVQAGY
jgi:alpha-beta hydrolase superfamily lysophospholipase